MNKFRVPLSITVVFAILVFAMPAQAHHEITPNTSGYVFLRSWGAEGDQFRSPWGVAISPDANTIYVANTGLNRVTRISRQDRTFSSLGGLGIGNGQFQHPQGIAVDSGGNVYVADSYNNRIQKFSSAGTYLTQWGSGGSGSGQFLQPYGVAVDSGGNVYVADNGNNRIQKFSRSVTQ